MATADDELQPHFAHFGFSAQTSLRAGMNFVVHHHIVAGRPVFDIQITLDEARRVRDELDYAIGEATCAEARALATRR